VEISALSTEYVKVPVTAVVNGVVIDPSSDTVQLAFPLRGVAPVSGDWKAGSWETLAGVHYARCLVGPSGTITLATGTFYDAWLKVFDSPETVVRKLPEQIYVY
jgi:hypothetical protein